MKSHPKARLLVADDDPPSLLILAEHLRRAGYEVVEARDGRSAWERLTAPGVPFDAVVLDQAMPDMSGLDVLAAMQGVPSLAGLPVVMQTAASHAEDIVRGLDAGAYYYLTKPYRRELLLAVVHAASSDVTRLRALQREIDEAREVWPLVTMCAFAFRTVAEARTVAVSVARMYPDPGRVSLGLLELFVNAVEHGNLGISYRDKVALLQENGLEEELQRRLARPHLASRRARVVVERREDAIVTEVEDEGDGFDWAPYLDFDADRACDPCGRGIAMARAVSFDSVEYEGRGNRVIAVASTRPRASLPPRFSMMSWMHMGSGPSE
jgi:DNA-binding response OmpR family regulator